jgi:hypothetical protein
VLATRRPRFEPGLSFAKIRAMRDLAEKVAAGVVPNTEQLHTLDSDAIIKRITQVRGIGRWTVEMLLIFQLGRPDVLPVDDFGVCNGFRLVYGLKGMPRPRALAEFGARWAPQRSLAAWYLWRAVELAATRNCRTPGARRASPFARSAPPAAENRRGALERKRGRSRYAGAPALISSADDVAAPQRTVAHARVDFNHLQYRDST